MYTSVIEHNYSFEKYVGQEGAGKGESDPQTKSK